MERVALSGDTRQVGASCLADQPRNFLGSYGVLPLTLLRRAPFLDRLNRAHCNRHWAGRTSPCHRIRARAHGRRLLAGHLDPLSHVRVEFYFPRGLKFVGDCRILLNQDVISAKPTHTALHRHLPLSLAGILRSGSGLVILRQGKTCGKQQNKQEWFHR